MIENNFDKRVRIGVGVAEEELSADFKDGVLAVLVMLKTEPSVHPAIGRWKKKDDDFLTLGGTPYYVCGRCGKSGHLHGAEFSKRKIICDNCGRINIYPWETAHEQGSSFWEEDDE